MKSHLTRSVFVTAMIGGLCLRAFALEEVKAPETVEALQKCITQIVSQPRYHAALWGVKIVSLDTKKTLFEHNAEKLFSPASNSKLYTMALALDRLGPDYRIQTSLYAQAKPNRWGTLKGDLMVFGRGDPTINLKLHGSNIYSALEPLVAVLTNAGVKRISGDLIGDESYFHGPPYGSGWDWDDFQYYYGAEISSLTINDNTLQMVVKPGERIGAPCRLSFVPATGYLTVSNRTQTAAKGVKRSISLYRPVAENVIYVTGQVAMDDAGSIEDVTMHNPAGLFVSFFKEALARRGITVAGRVRTVNWVDRQAQPLDLKQWTELGVMESLPMRDILREVQKPSQNLYTDLMLAHVGMQRQGNGPMGPDDTTEGAGVKALRAFLTEAGIPPGETMFNEGSGLSRNNLTTPNATVTLLQYMKQHKCSDIYINALPIAGVDGTLRKRMKGTVAAGNVRAKTGTLGWANSLSGYVTTAAGEHLVFSMMLNRFHNTETDRSKTADLDAIAVMLAGFKGRTGE
ncbi:MAG: D-alanyl-D-alanine carboxypeptidase/D-alanyl-D-alanine-endopeptidase [Pedosphaera sp.]|nr:D-alanyl-D-alanine carboxypeptidase/D-alanyl-D-alanine-endopeptidase [Pedosphaera sp.]